MSVLVDTNILVYAANQKCPEHSAARRTLDDLRDGQHQWFLTWGVIYEFLRVATHPAITGYPISAESAVMFIGRLLDSPQLRILKETDVHFAVLRETLRDISEARGNVLHDVHIAVVMREHDVPTILTADKGFHRFKHLKVMDPVHAA